MTTKTVAQHTPGYEVTADGRVFSADHNWRGYGRRELQQTPNADGYPSVRLMIDGKRKRLAVYKRVVEWDRTADANESAALETALDAVIEKAKGGAQ